MCGDYMSVHRDTRQTERMAGEERESRPRAASDVSPHGRQANRSSSRNGRETQMDNSKASNTGNRRQTDTDNGTRGNDSGRESPQAREERPAYTVDPDFEFNAPHFHDFLGEEMPQSPADAWFDRRPVTPPTFNSKPPRISGISDLLDSPTRRRSTLSRLDDDLDMMAANPSSSDLALEAAAQFADNIDLDDREEEEVRPRLLDMEAGAGRKDEVDQADVSGDSDDRIPDLPLDVTASDDDEQEPVLAAEDVVENTREEPGVQNTSDNDEPKGPRRVKKKKTFDLSNLMRPTFSSRAKIAYTQEKNAAQATYLSRRHPSRNDRKNINRAQSNQQQPVQKTTTTTANSNNNNSSSSHVKSKNVLFERNVKDNEGEDMNDGNGSTNDSSKYWNISTRVSSHRRRGEKIPNFERDDSYIPFAEQTKRFESGKLQPSHVPPNIPLDTNADPGRILIKGVRVTIPRSPRFTNRKRRAPGK